MPKPTQLATVQVGKQTVTVELAGEIVTINWPGVAHQVSAAKFPEVAATLTRMFANASTELSRIKAGTK